MSLASSATPAATVAQPSRLPELIALAAEPSSEKRRLLLRELTDHFFGASVRSEAESDLYGEVMSRLADDMEEAVRAELSRRFAVTLYAPRALARRLAADPSNAVAMPMLRQSDALDEADLMAAATTGDQPRLRAVSSRARVSEAVSEIIVQRGDDVTLGTLLGNDGARLSRAATEVAVYRARANPALHAVTVGRADLPPDLLNEMYFVVEQRLRERILARNARLNPAQLEDALSHARSRVAADDGALPADYAEAEAEVKGLAATGQLTPQSLARMLRAGSRTAFLIALADMADIGFHTARQIVERCEIDALAVVCKAADLDRSLFLTYAVVLLAKEGDALAKAQTYTTLYNDLDRDTALRTLRFWRMRRA